MELEEIILILTCWGDFDWPPDPNQPFSHSLSSTGHKEIIRWKRWKRWKRTWVTIRTGIMHLQSTENIVNTGKINLICGQLKIKENVEEQKQN